MMGEAQYRTYYKEKNIQAILHLQGLFFISHEVSMMGEMLGTSIVRHHQTHPLPACLISITKGKLICTKPIYFVLEFILVYIIKKNMTQTNKQI